MDATLFIKVPCTKINNFFFNLAKSVDGLEYGLPATVTAYGSAKS